MEHSLKKKRRKLWIWKALDRDTGQLLDWECGRQDKKTLPTMVDRLAQWDVQMYCTDTWATSASVIPRTSWCKVKRRRTLLSGITADSATGLAASHARQSLPPSPQRWWISRWPCSRSSGSMGTRT